MRLGMQENGKHKKVTRRDFTQVENPWNGTRETANSSTSVPHVHDLEMHNLRKGRDPTCTRLFCGRDGLKVIDGQGLGVARRGGGRV